MTRYDDVGGLDDDDADDQPLYPQEEEERKMSVTQQDVIARDEPEPHNRREIETQSDIPNEGK